MGPIDARPADAGHRRALERQQTMAVCMSSPMTSPRGLLDEGAGDALAIAPAGGAIDCLDHDRQGHPLCPR